VSEQEQVSEGHKELFIGEKFLKLFEPFSYKAIYGGRGSAKSHTVATVLVVMTSEKCLRVVCARQFQASIKDSVKELLEQKIKSLGLSAQFKSTRTEIINIKTGSRFSFIGLDINPQSAKSLEGADICWVEEAATINSISLEILLPTIRKPGAEVWFTWNPDQSTDPVDAMFRGKNGPPPNSLVIKVGIEDNPFFYQTNMPEKASHMKHGNPTRYKHIWEGEYDEGYETKIFSNVIISDIDVPLSIAPRYGMDFGFGQDPSFITKVYVWESKRVIYIAKEAYGCVPLSSLPALMESVVDSSSDLIKADSSQPGTIDHLNSQGFNLHGAKKGPGSVKSGITWLQGYTIYISPSCPGIREEARLYSWQVDRMTKKKLSVPVDAHNHGWDSIRYATEDCQTIPDDDDADSGVLTLRFGR